MTENLAKYIPLAFRVGSAVNSHSQEMIESSEQQNQAMVMDKNPFLVDAKFSLRLDEII